MASRAYNMLDGMGEAILALARKHSTPRQWAAWLKVPLQGAAREGDITMVTALLKAGAASFGERERDGQTPLHAAAEGGSLDVVMALLKGKAARDVNKTTRVFRFTPLHCAVRRGYEDIALALVRASAEVDIADYHGWSPLMRASADGRAELVNNLLLSRASANFQNKQGNRPLQYAVQHGHLNVIKVLLKAGASLAYRRKPDGMSVVEIAAKRGDTSALKELLAAGPNSGALDDDNMQAALNIAAREGHAGAIDVLIDAGADPDDPNDEGITDTDTPLHLACSYLQPNSVRALLRRNADETILNADSDFPEDIVGHDVPEERRDEEVVEWICEMLARAPADRVWRRRGWLAMLNARRRRTFERKRLEITRQQEQRSKNGNDKRVEGEAEGHGGGVKRLRRERGVEVLLSSPAASRKKVSVESAAEEAARDMLGSDHMHPSLKSFHWTVTKMVDVTDELVFRRIVSYL